MFRKSIAAPAALLFVAGTLALAQTPFEGFQLLGPAGAVELAELRFSNGNVVKFIGTADGEEVMYAETTPAGPNESYLFGEETPNVLEAFLALTPDYVPVPRMLVEVSAKSAPAEPDAEDGAVADGGFPALESKMSPTPQSESAREQVARRNIVDRLSAPIYISLASTKVMPRAAATGGSCGSDGADYFEENHCDTFDWHGYGEAEGYCYNGAWDSVQKTSSEPMRVTYSRTAACGTGGDTRHLRNTASGWDTVLIGLSAPNTVATYWSTRTGVAWKRRTRMEAQDPDAGFVRAWIHYFKQVTE